jgi:uncharacterized protein
VTNEACPLPKPPSGEQAAVIERLLKAQRIAIVGISTDPTRPSHQIAGYLMQHGKQIVPVNPNHDEVFGLMCHPTLRAVPGKIDLVNVFRRPEFCPQVVREAIEAGAKGVWLQSGIISEESRRLAEQAGIDFVQDQCIMVQHMRRR